jgi:hypothetical protein
MTIARPVRLAVLLWTTWAVVVWNVVFDRVIVLAGRRYVYAAANAAQSSGSYLLIKDWMGPAIVRGIWTATTVAGGLLVLGLTLIVVAARWDALRTGSQAAEPHAHHEGT